MKGNGAVCTIVATNYLAHARCLMDSVARFHPEIARFVILVDKIDQRFDVASEAFEIIQSDRLAIPNTKWFHFKYTLLELCTAIKPYAIDHLFSTHGFDFVIYLDPDILVCAGLDALLERFQDCSLLLTPHLTHPLDENQRPTELDILRTGTYNLGFIGVARTDEAFAFLRWWRERLYDFCVIDPPRGLFVDQRWMDFAPSFVSHIGIVREPQYNVAYWNLSQRQISCSGRSFMVNDLPLCFYHFSGFDPDDTATLSKYQSHSRLARVGPLRDLVEHYRKLLFDYGYRECRNRTYVYQRFNNGVEIPDVGRSLHWESPGIVERIEDPFSDEGYREFVRVWNRPLQIARTGTPPITRIAYKVYRTSSDAQAAMPDIFNGDYSGFVTWLRSVGSAKFNLPDVFLAPFNERADTASTEFDEPLTHYAGREGERPDGSWRTPPRSSRQVPSDSISPALQTSTEGTDLGLTRLARQIYDKRPDLQAFFPDPCGRDRVKYLVWLLTYGKRSYQLTGVSLVPLRQQWAAAVDSLPNSWVRLRFRVLLFLLSLSVSAGPTVGRVLRAPIRQFYARYRTKT